MKLYYLIYLYKCFASTDKIILNTIYLHVGIYHIDYTQHTQTYKNSHKYTWRAISNKKTLNYMNVLPRIYIDVVAELSVYGGNAGVENISSLWNWGEFF